MVRGLCKVILGHFVVSELRSVNMHLIPCFESWKASSRPAGPAPTIRTGVLCSTTCAVLDGKAQLALERAHHVLQALV